MSDTQSNTQGDNPNSNPSNHPGTIQLIRGRWIFTGDELIDDGAVAIQSDRIMELGRWTDLRAKYPNSEVLGSSQHAVLPGLINAHHHSNGVPNSLQGVDDDFLESVKGCPFCGGKARLEQLNAVVQVVTLIRQHHIGDGFNAVR
ncbi:imidazolonepropionase-like domain-containing protein [Leptolyngbya sp. 7M]|uniref:amidohydrolase family protein n=1 Tax=Leptolyngbya sp. 7M TaxID=2812896 RepID=UPI001B8C4E1C|nr:hypothetical protein [Leptolyngbya sp. 7M]QYO65142.1 hypothetical protein JVX88_37570 [Leptolyngbya sp. 7M]